MKVSIKNNRIPSGIQEVEAAVLIIDAVHSTEIAQKLFPEKYDQKFLKPLHKCYRSILASFEILEQSLDDKVALFYPEMKDFVEGEKIGKIMSRYVCEQNLEKRTGGVINCEFDVRGDQLTAIFFSGNLETDIEVANFIALSTFDRWIQREPNLERIQNGMDPYFLRAGLHCGKITIGIRNYGLRPNTITAEGYAINVAKKVSDEGSGGTESKIFMSGLAYKKLKNGIQEGWEHNIEYKSTGKDFQGYEIFELVYSVAPVIETFVSPKGILVEDTLVKYFLTKEIKYPINIGLVKMLQRHLIEGERVMVGEFEDLKKRVCEYLKIPIKKLERLLELIREGYPPE